MSETKAAFAEKTNQSLKQIIYRCIEDHRKNSFTIYLIVCLQGNVASIDLLGNHIEMSRILTSSQF